MQFLWLTSRYLTNTLMYQTIVTKFVTSGQKCDKISTPTNRVVVRFLACAKNFVTSQFSLSRVCPHFVTPQNPVINVCEGFDTKCDKISEITNNIFIFFKKILLAIYKYLSHLCIFYV